MSEPIDDIDPEKLRKAQEVADRLSGKVIRFTVGDKEYVYYPGHDEVIRRWEDAQSLNLIDKLFPFL